MRVLMLGWEYPPHIAGGLGKACEGLTTALSKRGIGIHFVVPHLLGGEFVNHMALSDANGRLASRNGAPSAHGYAHGSATSEAPLSIGQDSVSTSVETVRVPAFLTPYWRPETYLKEIVQVRRPRFARSPDSRRFARRDSVARALIEGEVYGVDVGPMIADEINAPWFGQHYGGDIFEEVERYTAQVVSRMAFEEFDLIHAHDWMTFPAGVALSQISGKPLVVHVHSLEYDRAGLFVNDQINDIERFGLESASQIVAVSYYTKRAIERHHRIEADRIQVVHNGVYPEAAMESYRIQKTWPRHVVLFLGRVTFQKGPDYFVEVANRVVPHVPDVLFVLAGSGDMLEQLKRRVSELDLSDYFLFPGFLKGEEVEEMFSLADLYVMPSVSEPFGLTALEAIKFDTPVIISRQSGVAEVLDNVLKVDFWDLDRLADLIINSLLHKELRDDLVTMAREEVRRLHWDAAAERMVKVYRDVLA